MSLDRAELAGTGAALAFHVALVVALSINLARIDTPAEPPSMEVELVDDIGLTAAAPQALAPPPSEAPEIGEAERVEPAPAIAPPPPPPSIVPTPTPRVQPTPPVKRAPAKAAPAKAPARPAPRASRIGDDFLKGVSADAPAASRAPSAATFNAAAKADVAAAIAAQIRPCALRQRALGEGANRIRVVLNIRLTPTGRLKGAPTVIRTTGVDEENLQYEELVKDQAIASYRECAPLRLPAELYQTPQGGWSNINMTYRLP